MRGDFSPRFFMHVAFSLTTQPDAAYASGNLNLSTLKEAQGAMKALGQKPKILSLQKLELLDTTGALLLKEWEQSGISLHHIRDDHHAILQLIPESVLSPLPEPKKIPSWKQPILLVGQKSRALSKSVSEMIAFFGQVMVPFARLLVRPGKLPFGSVVYHLEHIGIRAIPIVGLIAFLISIVLAYQSVAQLRVYGGEQFTVNLVAISVLREMGVLLTAIMVAGRSGSAFTAEIGVMKAREEVDALRVIGISPLQVLVIPRLLALIIAMPLLTMIANIMGLIGGGVMAVTVINMSLPQYLDRLHMVAKWNDLLVGLIKAPVFALFIGLVGCLHGMKVSGSAESVGRETTASVVKAIFLVLVLDAIFSVVFQRVGL